MKVAIASDHGGFNLKTKIIEFLKEKGISHEDFGTYSCDSVDYPEFGEKVALAVAQEDLIGAFVFVVQV